ncbi:MAG: hypothetical protein RMX35_25015 [Nostoc sp. DcaGUA01]|nr:hypothetical protein [Nostoc sp. DcaGUA01]
MKDGILWNLLDEDNQFCGQAAVYSKCTYVRSALPHRYQVLIIHLVKARSIHEVEETTCTIQ